PEQEKYICQQIVAAGGGCWFMINESGEKIYDRYRYMHAKYMIVDGERGVVSSENWSANSLPFDDKEDGSWGRRGVVLVSEQVDMVAALERVWAADFGGGEKRDLLAWTANHPLYGNKYGAPEAGFEPDWESGGVTYTVRYTEPWVVLGEQWEMVTAPETSLVAGRGLLGLIERAGAGDEVWVEALMERPWWGPAASNGVVDPNPRLMAYVDAARRGARVRILLDGYFHDETNVLGNWSTCAYVREVASEEHLDLDCMLGNPAGLGIHNKMVLVRVGGRGYIHVGSLNGSEQASKGNRELAWQVQTDEGYALLAGMVGQDWPYRMYFPVMVQQYQGAANHLLISEVLYDPAGADMIEFVEVVNPTASWLDLSGYSLSDAVYPTDFEDLRRWPLGTMLAPGDVLVVARSGVAFRERFGFWPDFEIDDTEGSVPEMIDDLGWGDPAAVWQLGNGGDEVIVRDAEGEVVDVVVYGAGEYPGSPACTELPPVNSDISLERVPYWLDRDLCDLDFQIRLFPTPGYLP
ncbi:MAG TPA: lamin tail domain-containing protein, partial [Anaerolineae bacterium]|nr:lamin tail domain-containing protein [Anaerolineae bacterium]